MTDKDLAQLKRKVREFQRWMTLISRSARGRGCDRAISTTT
jgi:hypothetical protein